MGLVKRLQAAARITYNVAWLLAVIAVIGHITHLNLRLSNLTNITGRNLLEASLLLFLVAIASDLRVLSLSSGSTEEKQVTKAAAKSA